MNINQLKSTIRAVTAVRLAIRSGKMKLPQVVALMHGDAKHAAMQLGLTIATNADGKVSHDLDTPEVVDLINAALGAGYKSDVLDELADVRIDCRKVLERLSA